jgi:hypothetical protein
MQDLRKFMMVLVTMLIMACGASKDESAPNTGSGDYDKKVNGPAGSAKAIGDFKAKEESDGTTEGTDREPIQMIERKLIKNGEVYYKTKSLTETKKRILEALKTYKGYVAKENAYDYSENPQEELIVRIPSQNFDEFLNTILKGADKVDSKKIDIEDVTEEFVDIEARLKNKKALENKYQELLKQAKDMEDILAITREMNSIREEIESTEGRLKYLSSQVNYSTLKINYYQNKPQGFNFGGKVGDALGNGGTGFLWFLIVMVQLWPLWLVGAIVWWFIVWMIKRNRKKKQAA